MFNNKLEMLISVLLAVKVRINISEKTMAVKHYEDIHGRYLDKQMIANMSKLKFVIGQFELETGKILILDDFSRQLILQSILESKEINFVIRQGYNWYHLYLTYNEPPDKVKPLIFDEVFSKNVNYTYLLPPFSSLEFNKIESKMKLASFHREAVCYNLDCLVQIFRTEMNIDLLEDQELIDSITVILQKRKTTVLQFKINHTFYSLNIFF